MSEAQSVQRGLSRGARIALWSAAVALLAIPAIGMQFSDEVNWGPGDFVVIGGMLVLLIGAIEAAMVVSPDRRTRIIAMTAAVALFLLIWAELAVGIFD